MERAFLTARWEDLVVLTWRVDAELLRRYLPAGVEPDRQDGDPEGTAYVSLVAFRFLDTVVKGIPIPLHRDFPEVNLRIYVRTTDEETPRRGVAFIAEFVPKPAIAAVANVVYHEHYRVAPMEVVAKNTEPKLRRLTMKIEMGEREHTMSLLGRRTPVRPPEDSTAHFFKEHEWGFGRDGNGDRVIYRVHHPVWDVYPVVPHSLKLDVGFEELYGEPWGCLDGRAPDHVAYAVGSEISVFDRED